MTYYAIMRKSDSKLLSLAHRANCKSYAKFNFSHRMYTPRIFPTKACAKAALTAWLSGIWRRSDWESLPEPDKQPDRIPGDYMVVKVRVVIEGDA